MPVEINSNFISARTETRAADIQVAAPKPVPQKPAPSVEVARPSKAGKVRAGGGSLKVTTAYTAGGAVTAFVITIPIEMLEQWKKNGVINYEEVFKKAGGNAAAFGFIGAGQSIAVKWGVPQGGFVRITMFLPAVIGSKMNPGEVGVIGTGTAMNYATFEATMRIPGLPAYVKFPLAIVASMLEGAGYNMWVDSKKHPALGNVLRSRPGQIIGKGLERGMEGWMIYDTASFLVRHPGVVRVGGPVMLAASIVLWPEAPPTIGEFNDIEIIGGLYDLAALGEEEASPMTRIEYPKYQPDGVRPEFKEIRLIRSNIFSPEKRSEWVLEDLFSSQRVCVGPLYFESVLHLYKLGYITKEDLQKVGRSKLVNAFDAVDFSDPQKYREAYDLWMSARGKNMEELFVSAIKKFKTDVRNITGEDTDGSPDVFGKETAMWMLYLSQAKVANDAKIKQFMSSGQYSLALAVATTAGDRKTADLIMAKMKGDPAYAAQIKKFGEQKFVEMCVKRYQIYVDLEGAIAKGDLKTAQKLLNDLKLQGLPNADIEAISKDLAAKVRAVQYFLYTKGYLRKEGNEDPSIALNRIAGNLGISAPTEESQVCEVPDETAEFDGVWGEDEEAALQNFSAERVSVLDESTGGSNLKKKAYLWLDSDLLSLSQSSRPADKYAHLVIKGRITSIQEANNKLHQPLNQG